MYHIAKNFHEFCDFVAIRESFLCEIWGHSVRWWPKRIIHERFLAKIIFSANSWKFSSLKVLHYTVWLWMYCWVLGIFLSWRAVCSNKIIKGSCVNSADIMTSICVPECTRQFEYYKYTLYIGMQYATRFKSNSKYQAQLTKIQYTQL